MGKNNVRVLPIIAEVVVLVKTRDTYSPCHEEQGAPHRCAAEMKLGSLLDTHHSPAAIEFKFKNYQLVEATRWRTRQQK